MKLFGKGEIETKVVETKVNLAVDSLNQIYEVEIRKWLAYFVIGNIESILLIKEKLTIFYKIDKELLEVKVKGQSTVGPQHMTLLKLR